jgi:hypothetical protein
MISAVLFILLALFLFYYVVSPLFEDFKKIPVCEMEEEIRKYEEANFDEFKNDLESGKIGEEELSELKVKFKKEMKDE